MQRLEGSGTPVLYIGRKVLKGYCVLESSSYATCDQFSQPSFFLLSAGYPCPAWHSVTLSVHFSHDRPTWSSPFFSKTTFPNFPGISAVLFEVFNTHHHARLCYKIALYYCSIFLYYLEAMPNSTCCISSLFFVRTVNRLMLERHEIW